MTDGHNLDPYTFGPDQRCFGCGPHNPVGLKLRFRREGDEVVTRFVPSKGYEGPPGVFHGGLQATLADEVGGWTLVGILGRMGFTTSMNVRYIRPVRIEQEVELRSKVTKQHQNLVTMRVKLTQNGKTGMVATVSYALPEKDKVRDYLQAEPDPVWAHLLEGDASE